ncbi:MAG: alpha/beta hydrolase fold protein [Solirubrobacterales bacterium]|nr:alpha/beta hydrolase fold protein [Solirubrobacterales bacterium]
MIADDLTFDGARERIAVHRWTALQPRYVVLLAHGYGEHAGRYEHVAQALVADGATVFAPDHAGHGASGGERALVTSIDDLVADLHTVAGIARDAVPDVPVVLIGHSMGGIIATRYAQLHGEGLAALVLSGPVIGGNPDLIGLLDLDPIPDIPIDPAVLSRDPAVGAAYAADGLVYHGPFRRETLLGFMAAITAIAEGPSLGELPTLWIHGEEDALAPLAATREAVERIRGPRLEEKVYPEARHEIFNETNQDEVIGDVLAFVAKVI